MPQLRRESDLGVVNNEICFTKVNSLEIVLGTVIPVLYFLGYVVCVRDYFVIVRRSPFWYPYFFHYTKLFRSNALEASIVKSELKSGLLEQKEHNRTAHVVNRRNPHRAIGMEEYGITRSSGNRASKDRQNNEI